MFFTVRPALVVYAPGLKSVQPPTLTHPLVPLATVVGRGRGGRLRRDRNGGERVQDWRGWLDVLSVRASLSNVLGKAVGPPNAPKSPPVPVVQLPVSLIPALLMSTMPSPLAVTAVELDEFTWMLLLGPPQMVSFGIEPVPPMCNAPERVGCVTMIGIGDCVLTIAAVAIALTFANAAAPTIRSSVVGTWRVTVASRPFRGYGANARAAPKQNTGYRRGKVIADGINRRAAESIVPRIDTRGLVAVVVHVKCRSRKLRRARRIRAIEDAHDAGLRGCIGGSLRHLAVDEQLAAVDRQAQ